MHCFTVQKSSTIRLAQIKAPSKYIVEVEHMQKKMKLPIRAAPYRHQTEAADFALNKLAHVIPQPLKYQDSDSDIE